MNRKLTIPQVVAMIAAIMALIAFFLPYISATAGYRSYMADQAEEKPFEGIDITVSEIMDMSLFKYVRVYFQGGELFFSSSGMGTLYGVIVSLTAGFAFFSSLAAWRGRPILTLVCSLLMSGAVYLVNWDFVDRGIMPDYNRVWAIAYHLYYPLAAVIAVCAIWMLIARRQTKTLAE